MCYRSFRQLELLHSWKESRGWKQNLTLLWFVLPTRRWRSLKRRTLRALISNDFNEAQRRQAQVYVDGIRDSFSGTMTDVALGTVKATTPISHNGRGHAKTAWNGGQAPGDWWAVEHHQDSLEDRLSCHFGQDEWSGDTAGGLHLSCDEVTLTGHTYFGFIPGGCLREELPYEFGRKSLPNDGTSVAHSY